MQIRENYRLLEKEKEREARRLESSLKGGGAAGGCVGKKNEKMKLVSRPLGHKEK